MDCSIAMAQINVTVGDISGNAQKIISAIREAQEQGADIVLFPELALCGYPPLDLILEDEFISENRKQLLEIAAFAENIIAIVGVIHLQEERRYNALAVMQNGRIIDYVLKTNLPTYDVFDELRYFSPNRHPQPIPVKIKGNDRLLGIEICEDLWDNKYEIKVTRELAEQGADIILNASASPYCVGKIKQRIALVREKVEKFRIPFVYVNLVGGQDELIFDGNSFALDAEGRFAAYMPASQEAMGYCRFTDGRTDDPLPVPEFRELEELRSALILGIRDYFYKSGFRDAVIGLSGGIDSALVTILASEALGPAHVYTYAMPSVFSSDHSLADARKCAENSDVHFDIIPINPMYDTFLKSLEKPFAGTAFGLAEENLQARIRGTLLMSIANKKKALVLTTGNKTELALGYCTLYGDMCGGLAPISDLNKPDVYRLANYLNAQYGYDVIPENTIRKKPSAELAENQFDPFDYDIVSPIVDDLLCDNRSVEQLIRDTGDPDLVYRIFNLIRTTEYKRWQAAPGLRVTPKAFGQGRRMPMINHFAL
ncbi:MAG: NAD+ synthase [Candidatus Marinimicrobia bacterium]|nr:NAD+ synthase [Candidatus Neomarinimicrobiota bacterium]